MRVSETENRQTGTQGSGELTNLPFGQYQPYRMISDTLDRIREGARPLQILDASGGDTTIRKFLPEDDITVLEPAGEIPAALPFEDGAFHYVVSVDALARAEPAVRNEHLSELRRVTRKGILLASPFDSGVVRGAERAANDLHHAVHGEDEPRLRQHTEHGLPALDDTRSLFENLGDSVSVLPNGYVPHWLAMTGFASYSSSLGGGMDGALRSLDSYYNEFVYALGNAEPSYRHVLVSLRESVAVDLDGLASPTPGSGRAAADLNLFGAFSAVLPLASEIKRIETRSKEQLAEYERRLAEKEGLLARREAQVNDLSGRVAALLGLYEQNAELARQRKQMERQLRAITESKAWRMLALPRAIRRRILQFRGSE